MLSYKKKQWIEVGAYANYLAGALCIAFFGSQVAMGEVQRSSDIKDFELGTATIHASAASDANSEASSDEHLGQVSFDRTVTGSPDMSLWAPQRVLDYQTGVSGDVPAALGVLEVPSVGLKVPVYPSDSELNMDRGAGVIDGMSYPHEGGNIGIAGHRDGYFRALKDVQPGDKLLLQTIQGPKQFVIDATQIIDIEDTWVLKDTRQQKVTLVTCYPFYFVGHAPQRFVVTASLDTPNVDQH